MIQWIIGSTQTITWTSLDVPTNVQILLSRNNGISWEIIIADTVNSGSYQWIVTGPNTGQALIKVTGLLYIDPIDTSQTDYSTVTSISDEFSISLNIDTQSLNIDTQPQSQNLSIGSILSLSVSVSGGSGYYSYQWKRNSVNVPGATGNPYMAIMQEGLAGSYTVTVSDGISSATSNTAVISYPFTINTQPISQGTYTGGALNFVITVSGGSGSYIYQWQRDGSNIFDASSNSYVISSFNPLTNGGQYAVSTSDGTTTLLSNTVQAGSLTEVLGASTNMTTINNVPYKSSFVWELDPVTSLPVNVKVVNNF